MLAGLSFQIVSHPALRQPLSPSFPGFSGCKQAPGRAGRNFCLDRQPDDNRIISFSGDMSRFKMYFKVIKALTDRNRGEWRNPVIPRSPGSGRAIYRCRHSTVTIFINSSSILIVRSMFCHGSWLTGNMADPGGVLAKACAEDKITSISSTIFSWRRALRLRASRSSVSCSRSRACSMWARR